MQIKEWSAIKKIPLYLCEKHFSEKDQGTKTKQGNNNILPLNNLQLSSGLVVNSWNQASTLSQTLPLSLKGPLRFLMATYVQAWSFASCLENGACGPWAQNIFLFICITFSEFHQCLRVFNRQTFRILG